MQTQTVQDMPNRSSHAIVPSQMRARDSVQRKAACGILVVDANDISRQVMTTTLETAGYGVTAVGNAGTAEKAVPVARPDLIMQSLVLPDADCWELAARFRRASIIPIVGYACVLPPETRQDLKHGFAGFLTKPFAPSHLVRSLPFYLWNKRVPAPLAPSSQQAASWETLELQATLSDQGSQNDNVLIVEDNQFQREHLSEAFASAGFLVTLARHGIEALEKLGRNRPDLIVSDTLMTGCDGFELCLAVRKLPSMQGLGFLLTPPNLADPLDEAVARALGADAYVSRAGGFEQLIATARMLCRMAADSLSRS